MMRKAISFSAHGECVDSGYEMNALCVFFDARRELTILDLFDELTTSLNDAFTLPDCVLVIADTLAALELAQCWATSESQRNTFQKRCEKNGIPFVKAYHFVGWSPDSGLTVLFTEKIGAALCLNAPLNSFVYQGLHSLMKLNPVVQIAPAGHVFKHPSKNFSKIFIQAREIATNETELAFVGRCLVQEFSAIRTTDLAHVFIDSMGIYGMVREALSFSGSSARIYSFHSYDELSKLSPPTLPYAVVVSASTTGGMARQLHKEQGIEEARLLTLVDVCKHERCGGVLVALEDINPTYKNQVADGTEMQIELYGEHFSSKAKPPRAVALGLPHRPKRLGDFLCEFGTKALLPLNSLPSGRSTNRLVCVDSEQTSKGASLEKWLDDEIRWRVSASVNHVVCADDEGSKLLGVLAADILKKARGSTVLPKVCSYKDLNSNNLQEATGVLVVQSLAGDGGLLREISRDLREYLLPNVPRHFLVSVGLPQSEDAWSRLRQFLVRNSSEREYGFSAWLVLPVGADGTATAWQTYSDLFAKAQIEDIAVDGIPKQELDASIELATELDTSEVFFPSHLNAPLELTDGFVFFGNAFKDIKVSDIPVSATLTTVAAVLQAARDLSDPANQLRPTGYESVVLSPENFLRFNDNLLQACILRAANPSELDYSSSPHLSRLMKEFLLKVFERHAHAYGACALEFAAALASGRLRLISTDLEEVRNKAIERLKGRPSALLGLVCLIA